MKPICVPCGRFYRPEKNGVLFVEMVHEAPALGSGYSPYKLWSGDKWKCSNCGSEVIVGVGREPISEHYYPDFTETMERARIWQGDGRPLLQVNDR